MRTSESSGLNFVPSGHKANRIHRFDHRAMATGFEIFIVNKDKTYAEQAAHAAFSELDKLEQELSRFVENSEISRINRLRSIAPPRAEGLVPGKLSN